jgi:gliding motility-associated-like protein
VLSVRPDYPGAVYQWTPSLYLYCDTCRITTATPEEDICYEVKLQISSGNASCETDTIICIDVEPVFYFPNCITPNGDVHNEVFSFVGKNMDEIDVHSFTVFDRWGLAVHVVRDVRLTEVIWDGNNNGVPAPADVYDFLLIYSIDGEEKSLTGKVTVVR